MAIMMIMKWDGVTPEQYEECKQVVNWEGEAPEGGILHATAFDGDGLRITDVWESAESFQSFVQGRLMPGVEKVGVAGEPDVEIYPLHDLFTPGLS
jgi:hypothetical protein